MQQTKTYTFTDIRALDANFLLTTFVELYRLPIFKLPQSHKLKLADNNFAPMIIYSV